MNYFSKKIELFKLYLLAKRVKNQAVSLGSYKVEEYNNSFQINNRFLRNIETCDFDEKNFKFKTTDNLRFYVHAYYVQVMFMDFPYGTKELFCFSFIGWLEFLNIRCYDFKYVPVVRDELNKISKFLDDAKEYHSRLAIEKEQTLASNIRKTTGCPERI